MHIICILEKLHLSGVSYPSPCRYIYVQHSSTTNMTDFMEGVSCLVHVLKAKASGDAKGLHHAMIMIRHNNIKMNIVKQVYLK